MKPWPGVRSITLISSPSSRKTRTIYRILQIRNRLFDCKQTDLEMQILYCYSIDQEAYTDMKNEFGDLIVFKKGIPCRSDIDELTINRHYLNILVIDDLVQEVYHNAKISLNWIWYEGRHLNLCTLFSIHNYTATGSIIININTSAVLLFRSVFAASVLQIIARQAFVGKSKVLKACYDDAMAVHKYSFLCIDFSPHCKDEFKISTTIFSDDSESIIYVMEWISQAAWHPRCFNIQINLKG